MVEYIIGRLVHHKRQCQPSSQGRIVHRKVQVVWRYNPPGVRTIPAAFLPRKKNLWPPIVGVSALPPTCGHREVLRL